jgi:hexosaminidase
MHTSKVSAIAQINILPTPEKIEILSGTHKYDPSEAITFLQTDLGQEGYELEVTRDGIVIRASGKAGEFYAMQSLRQLVYHAEGDELPCVKLSDHPKYAWRSFMIDSARQYQQVETIKGLLDRMALLKMNVFHWHLTDDPGWRIEIKAYPKLTEVGAFVSNGKEQHGFYTQEEIKEIVRYAAERNITIVPEIDVPGHSEAALKAYPELTCTGQLSEDKGNGHSPILYCGGREDVTEFLCNVLDEVCDLFPSEHIHLGGDEAPKAEWEKCTNCTNRIQSLGLKNTHELQIDLTNRLARHLAAKGRKVICWGDVVHCPGQGLEDNIIIHWWSWRRHKDQALHEAIRRDMQVIANPNKYTYLNYPQKHDFGWFKAPERTFDLQTCYEKNPGDSVNLPKELHAPIMGMGTCLWADCGLTEDLLDYRLFPRLFALAEQMWSTARRLPFDEFKTRVYSKRDFLARQGIQGDWDEKH